MKTLLKIFALVLPDTVREKGSLLMEEGRTLYAGCEIPKR